MTCFKIVSLKPLRECEGKDEAFDATSYIENTGLDCYMNMFCETRVRGRVIKI